MTTYQRKGKKYSKISFKVQIYYNLRKEHYLLI